MTFGLYPGIFKDGRPNWGARAILDRHGNVDIVWDRQQMEGGDDLDRQRLAKWLETKGIPRLRRMLRKSPLGLYENDEVQVLQGGYILMANPKASYGYLYITAYPVKTGERERVMRVTINDVCKRMNVDYPTARGLLCYLRARSLAKVAGRLKNEGGKGKGQDVYELPLTLPGDVGSDLACSLMAPQLDTQADAPAPQPEAVQAEAHVEAPVVEAANDNATLAPEALVPFQPEPMIFVWPTDEEQPA